MAMKANLTALVFVIVCSAALAQGSEPSFGDLPANPSERDLTAVVRSLLARVTELERRVNELEGANANRLAAEPARTVDPEAARLLAAAVTERGKLSRHLDGFTRADPVDARLQYSLVKRDAGWDTVVADAKRYTDALKAAVGKASGLKDDSKSTLEGQIRWARGRTIYQVKRLNVTNHVLLPLDFATDVVPLEEKK